MFTNKYIQHLAYRL